jgi:hypothetical protein
LAPAVPEALPVRFEGLPEAIKSERRFVVWKYDERWVKTKGRFVPAKVPYQPVFCPPDEFFSEQAPGDKAPWPVRAKSNDPSTWGTLEQAERVYRENPELWKGIGFMLGDGWGGADCDDCVLPDGTILPFAQEIHRRLCSYTEVSTSRTGTKTLVQGVEDVVGKCRKEEGRSLELYSKARLFCLTGHRLGTCPANVEDRRQEFLDLYHEQFPDAGKKKPKKKTVGPEPRANGQAPKAAAEGLRKGLKQRGRPASGKAPANVKEALRVFVKRVRRHYGDRDAARKNASKPNTYLCRCPAHDDQSPSLSVTVEHGRLLFHCHADSECDFTEVCQAVGFPPEWCFPPVTVNRLAKLKGLPVAFLEALGCKDWSRQVLIPYYGRDNHKVCSRRRVALRKGPGQDTTTYQQKGKPLHAYGEWADKLIPRSDELAIVEGETDTWTLWFHRIAALGLPGATAARVIQEHHLEGVKRVCVWQEPDAAGEGFARSVLARLRFLQFAGEVRVLRHDQYKDPSAMYLGERERFQEAWQALVGQAPAAAPAGEDEEDPKGLTRFDRLARAFTADLVAKGQHPVYHAGRFYLYDGVTYAEETELDMAIRNHFKAQGTGQSNNLVGNVRPIVQALAHMPLRRYGRMPFYRGQGDFPPVIAYKNGLLDLDAWLAGGVRLLPHTHEWVSTF